ncbi:L-type lectin-domain containing receptor kinase S.4-like [Nymphaea colorata]|uniref:L-type lectin-domain containing receptor kinase S.4-like n=1 Tax=Nymphaea colorata TaxID=210225 RepID=UPI00129D414E|nr:L-type lectin-domain containing receptor kinase S.4-like [Nymphaea colorata]
MPKLFPVSPFLLLCFLLTLPPSQSQPARFMYTGFRNLNASNITLVRTAEIEDSGMLRLTNETSRLIGRAFYPHPLTFRSGSDGSRSSFSTSFAFAIVPEYPKLGGHGLAFTLAPDPLIPGAQPSQYLGLMNASMNGSAVNHVFAVEFDTVQDFEFNDPDDNHVGVDVDSLRSSVASTAKYFQSDGSTVAFNLKGGETIVSWIDYDGPSGVLNVTVAPGSAAGLKPAFPLLSLTIDVPSIVGNSAYVGFSSSTGLLSSSHYLLGWSFALGAGAAESLDLKAIPSLPKQKSSMQKIRNVAIGTSVAAGLLFVVAAAAGFVIWRRIRDEADPIEGWELEYGPHRFPYRELAHATKGFGDKELLGFGGFGRVYRGVLPGTKEEVAVKHISRGSKQGLREFVAEVSSIGRLRHRNLVQLQGWCRRRGDLLLVYDYMPNSSLDKLIFDQQPGTQPRLGWAQRFRVLRGVASALLYLHEEWEQVVLHRDVKASNVLLDAELNGRLGDFGLARLYEHGSNPSTTRVVGTLGYLAPELTRTGKATTLSDVYAFGAVLLEVACGRRPIEPKAVPEELVLVDWVWALWCSGRILVAVDPLLQGEYEPTEALLVLKLGLMCSHPDQAFRPGMRQVMQYLDGDMPLPELPTDGPPVDYWARAQCFDDFVHSYPSSDGKASTGSAPIGRQPTGTSPLVRPVNSGEGEDLV